MSASWTSLAPGRQLLVGTYTERLSDVVGKGKGISVCTFADGRVGPPTVLRSIRNPAFIMSTSCGNHIYVASETREFEASPVGGSPPFLGTRPPVRCAC